MAAGRRARCGWLPALAIVVSLVVCGCVGAHSRQDATPVTDHAMTPAYDAFLQDLRLQRVSVQPLGLRQMYGHWSSAASVAADGCQCGQTWGTLYVEHRLRVDGRLVVVDEELLPGATTGLTPDAGGSAGAAERQTLHRYRRDNLLVTTTSTDSRLLGVLSTVLGAAVAE